MTRQCDTRAVHHPSVYISNGDLFTFSTRWNRRRFMLLYCSCKEITNKMHLPRWTTCYIFTLGYSTQSENSSCGGTFKVCVFFSQLSKLSNKTFMSLKKLHSLDFSSNQICEIPDGFLQGCPWAQDLNLANNKISLVGEKAFRGPEYMSRWRNMRNLY